MFSFAAKVKLSCGGNCARVMRFAKKCRKINEPSQADNCSRTIQKLELNTRVVDKRENITLRIENGKQERGNLKNGEKLMITWYFCLSLLS